MQTTPVRTPSDFIAAMWHNGQKALAKQQEVSARATAEKQGHKGYYNLFSCETEEWLNKFLTGDKDMLEVKRQVQVLQGYEHPVLIQGPTGTGKELLARALHGSRTGKFVAVNCTSLPDELLESELFGHTKGAFTGAVGDRVGKFRAAYNGTIFLDEIGDMPLSMQAKLLRVLQEKVVCPIGSDVEEPINCRVVAATNKSLTDVHFREDVLYRLNSFEIKTKGLIDRLGDIAEIVDSLGGVGLFNEFERWKTTNQYETCVQAMLPENAAKFKADIYNKFFSLSGNVRSLQAQVLRYKVLGVTK